MNATLHNTEAERVGVKFGRAWRAIARFEKQVAAWLVKIGLSVPMANASIWIIRLSILAAAFYSLLVLAVLVVVMLLMCVASHVDLSVNEEAETRLRQGPQGFGLYRGGVRLDPYDTDNQE